MHISAGFSAVDLLDSLFMDNSSCSLLGSVAFLLILFCFMCCIIYLILAQSLDTLYMYLILVVTLYLILVVIVETLYLNLVS